MPTSASEPVHDQASCDAASMNLNPALDESHLEFHLGTADNRERALPLRPGDLTRLLLSEPTLTDVQRQNLSDLCKIVASTFHSEFYQKLCELKQSADATGSDCRPTTTWHAG